MAASIFNLRVPLPNDDVFLMNTLTDAQLVVSTDVAALLDSVNKENATFLSGQEREALNQLWENGFLVEDRDAFRGRLRERGVETLVHYPEPIHKQAAYAHLPRVEVPVAERLCAQVVSLPLYPELTEPEAEQVVQAVLAG